MKDFLLGILTVGAGVGAVYLSTTKVRPFFHLLRLKAHHERLSEDEMRHCFEEVMKIYSHLSRKDMKWLCSIMSQYDKPFYKENEDILLDPLFSKSTSHGQ